MSEQETIEQKNIADLSREFISAQERIRAYRQFEIEQLREKIRQDMMDYKLLHTDENSGVDASTCYLFRSGNDPYFHGVRGFFGNYLEKQIDSNLAELKKLIEGDK